MPHTHKPNIRLLVINPNSSSSMSDDLERAIRKMDIAPDIAWRVMTAASPAPPSIDSVTDGVLSATAVLLAIGAKAQDILHAVDAVVVACFSPHPLVQMLKECYPGLLVVGIYEAAAQTALHHGRFGIMTTGAYWEPVLRDALESAAGVCKERCVGVRGTNVGVLALGHGEDTRTAMLASSLDLLRAGADAIVLGCAAMSPLAKQLQDDIAIADPWKPNLTTQRVPIVDGVRAAIDIAASLVRQSR